MDPKLYYTLIPYTKHPDLKGDFAVFLHSKAGEPVPEIVELKEWAYGDQVESEWKVRASVCAFLFLLFLLFELGCQCWRCSTQSQLGKESSFRSPSQPQENGCKLVCMTFKSLLMWHKNKTGADCNHASTAPSRNRHDSLSGGAVSSAHWLLRLRRRQANWKDLRLSRQVFFVFEFGVFFLWLILLQLDQRSRSLDVHQHWRNQVSEAAHHSHHVFAGGWEGVHDQSHVQSQVPIEPNWSRRKRWQNKKTMIGVFWRKRWKKKTLLEMLLLEAVQSHRDPRSRRRNKKNENVGSWMLELT